MGIQQKPILRLLGFFTVDKFISLLLIRGSRLGQNIYKLWLQMSKASLACQGNLKALDASPEIPRPLTTIFLIYVYLISHKYHSFPKAFPSL